MLFDTVIQVSPKNDFTIEVFYASGEIYLYDASKIPTLFPEMQDIQIFKDKCCVINQTLAFNLDGTYDTTSCYDLCPDTIKMRSIRLNPIAQYIN